MKQQTQFMVCVSCMTYNHAPYIEDAMNGFTMQHTSFPYVCTIIDDASTDGEPEVIRLYLQEHFDMEDKSIIRNEETDDYVMTFAHHKTNKNCFFAVLYLKYNHYSIKKSKMPYIEEWCDTKYIAFCEGDDYWIDSHKIQRQVDLMEKDEGIGLVFTKCSIMYQESGERTERKQSSKIILNDTLKWKIIDQSIVIDTSTTLLRNDIYIQIRSIKDDFNGFMMSDTQTWFNAARLSRVGYLPEVTSVYRKHPLGATSTLNPNARLKFLNNCLDMYLHLAHKYGAPEDVAKKIKCSLGFGIFCILIKRGEYGEAYQFNQKIYGNNRFLKWIINVLKTCRIKSTKGIGRFFRLLVNYGIIDI